MEALEVSRRTGGKVWPVDAFEVSRLKGTVVSWPLLIEDTLLLEESAGMDGDCEDVAPTGLLSDMNADLPDGNRRKE